MILDLVLYLSRELHGVPPVGVTPGSLKDVLYKDWTRAVGTEKDAVWGGGVEKGEFYISCSSTDDMGQCQYMIVASETTLLVSSDWLAYPMLDVQIPSSPEGEVVSFLAVEAVRDKPGQCYYTMNAAASEHDNQNFVEVAAMVLDAIKEGEAPYSKKEYDRVEALILGDNSPGKD